MRFLIAEDQLAEIFRPTHKGACGIYLEIPDYCIMLPPPPLEFNDHTSSVTCGHLDVRLPKTQYAILKYMYAHSEVTFEDIRQNALAEPLDDDTLGDVAYALVSNLEEAAFPYMFSADKQRRILSVEESYTPSGAV